MKLGERDLLIFQDIHKAFGGVHALRGISFAIREGEIHGLVGENGAGKSTLIKIATGVQHPDKGNILFDGRKVTLHSPRDAERLGIRVVHQEIPICLNLTVAENIFLDPRYPNSSILHYITYSLDDVRNSAQHNPPILFRSFQKVQEKY